MRNTPRPVPACPSLPLERVPPFPRICLSEADQARTSKDHLVILRCLGFLRCSFVIFRQEACYFARARRGVTLRAGKPTPHQLRTRRTSEINLGGFTMKVGHLSAQSQYFMGIALVLL